MRKIEDSIITAIRENKPFSGQNTTVSYSLSNEKTNITLHGHTIAIINHETNSVEINFCGFPTRTTASRINNVLEAMNKTERVSIKGDMVVLKPSQTIITANQKHTVK